MLYMLTQTVPSMYLQNKGPLLERNKQFVKFGLIVIIRSVRLFIIITI